MSILSRLFAKPAPAADPYLINASLAVRKANRPALKAQARSDAAKLGWETRRRAGA